MPDEYDERGAIQRMVASEAEIAAEPPAMVLSTPGGNWFYVRCRECLGGAIISGVVQDKALLERFAVAHNEVARHIAAQ